VGEGDALGLIETRVAPTPAARGAAIPWWGKIAAKLILARLLPTYALRRRFNIFIHSHRRPDEAEAPHLGLFFDRHRALTGEAPQAMLELGPGDSLAHALHAAARGCTATWLVDVGDFAHSDMARYAAAAKAVQANNSALSVDLSSRGAMLESLGARYLTAGLESLRTMPDNAVDIVVSFAVLEHVRRADFADVLAQTFRVLRPGGTAHHWIDLADHLGGALNNLRLPDAVWEHDVMAGSGFYTNRLRASEILTHMREAGFEAAVARRNTWPTPPTPRSAMAAPFRLMSDDELSTSAIEVLLRRPS
jgi:SAM-dependent methyltransferase